MRVRKILCVVFTCIVLMGCLAVPVGAVNETVLRASGRFSMEIPANTLATASTSFPLEAGETVSINAVYTPRTADLSFGLIAPDGYFYSMPATNGNFDETIEVDQRGQYTLAVRNRSSEEVSVSGYVYY